MEIEVVPRRIQLAAKQGLERMRKYRNARAMYIRRYAGKYYGTDSGVIGDEPINLMFHAIRSLVPSVVMQNPKFAVDTPILAQQEYGIMLALALNQLAKKMKLKDLLRGGVVDATFGMAIFKTALAASDQLITIGDTKIDPGQIYTDLVDVDDFIPDPVCKVWSGSAFIGHRSRVPRQLLLDDVAMDHDEVVTLARSTNPDAIAKTEALTRAGVSASEMYELQDFVDVAELWIPEANVILTIPDPSIRTTDKYLGVKEYYGPKEGPYDFLSMTQPVPNNPLPIAAAGIWHDLHVQVNALMVKETDRALRQKSVLMYDATAADEAEDIRQARDGDFVAGNPDTVKVVKLGESDQGTQLYVDKLRSWYNYMAANPDQIAGIASAADTATESTFMQGNAGISTEDSRGRVYDCAGSIGRKWAWFLHNDPMINIPLIKRQSGGERIQLVLTPEQRSGDFLDFTFNIAPRSMSTADPVTRQQNILKFGTNILPSLAATGTQLMMAGIPFNTQRAASDMASEMDILEQVEDWFVDPEYAKRMMLLQLMGPQNPGKAGAGTSQNGQLPSSRPIKNQMQQFNSAAQQIPGQMREGAV